ncbi:MAG: hypothetical protein IPH42_21445 [Bacteroidetes bacterium]|nr:hypothetical protein [Bacteroidota bacterium]
MKQKKLFLFRIVSFVYLLLFIILFLIGLADYALFSLLIFSFIFFTTISYVNLSSDSILIKKYYFPGILFSKYKLKIENIINISPYDIEIYPLESPNPFNSWLIDIFMFFLPRRKTILSRYIIKYTGTNNNEKTLVVKLSGKQYFGIKQLTAPLSEEINLAKSNDQPSTELPKELCGWT